MITAAHCFQFRPAEARKWKVKAGHVRMDKHNDEYIQIKQVTDILIHPLVSLTSYFTTNPFLGDITTRTIVNKIMTLL